MEELEEAKSVISIIFLIKYIHEIIRSIAQNRILTYEKVKVPQFEFRRKQEAELSLTRFRLQPTSKI